MAVSQSTAEQRRGGDPLIASDRVEGTSVFRPNGEKIGTIERIMIDKVSGKVAYAVMSFGGFLGMGERYFTLPWAKLDYEPTHEGYVVDVDEGHLKSAPDFDHEGEIWTDRRREEALHQHYRTPPYWMG